MKLKPVGALCLMVCIILSCNSATKSENKEGSDATIAKEITIHEEPVSYTLNGKEYSGFVSYNENIEGKRPGILVVHEWWGLNDYSRNRAKKLAGLGYVAMAVDMYGEGKTGDNPKEARALAMPFYKTPSMAKVVLDAAINKLQTFPQVDTSQMAAIGYCFGGFVVLNAAKLGASLKGVVSFHGGLQGVVPDKKLLTTKILVLHGAADEFENPHVAKFRKQMDSINADYIFKEYPNATHAFTNPQSTETGLKFDMPIKYNAAADSASWNDMKIFLRKVFSIK